MKNRNSNLAFNLAILVLMTIPLIGVAMADDVSPALNGNALMMKGWMDYAEWFVIVTLMPSVIMMLFMALSLHIARPMVLRYLNRMTLRLGADLLWEGWVIGRDVLILSAVGLLGIMIVPRVQADWNTGVFIPAFLLGIITLLYKLVWDTDASKTKYMVATGLTALTLIAVVIPYSIGPMWEAKGSEFFMNTYLIPISNADSVKDVRTAMNDAIYAEQKGDNTTAITKALEADAAHLRLGTTLRDWDSTKYSQMEDAFTALTSSAKNGDITGMLGAQTTINEVLNDYASSLGRLD
ncbi:MAG: hypothetical protein O8C61_05395 [Candidatus Methanoperedens sp.]|nr:hypothetical protein [Candidatus Methanoperedens sp.]